MPEKVSLLTPFVSFPSEQLLSASNKADYTSGIQYYSDQIYQKHHSPHSNSTWLARADESGWSQWASSGMESPTCHAAMAAGSNVWATVPQLNGSPRSDRWREATSARSVPVGFIQCLQRWTKYYKSTQQRGWSRLPVSWRPKDSDPGLVDSCTGEGIAPAFC